MPANGSDHCFSSTSQDEKCLALFDFDGTISFKDSLPDFIRFAIGNPRFLFGALSGATILLNLVFKRVSNEESKRLLLAHFFNGWSEQRWHEVAAAYAIKRLPEIVRADALHRLKQHQNAGHHVVVVTASIEDWIKPWCDSHQLNVIATQLAFSSERIFTGRFKTKNCYGPEKVRRIKKEFDLREYHKVYAYGDSAGDTEMLALAQHPSYKFFSSKHSA